MEPNTFTLALIQELSDRGHAAQLIGTGGNCQAVQIVEVDHEILVTDDDAAQPDYRTPCVMVHYVDGELLGTYGDTAQVDDPTPEDIAQVIHNFLHTNRFGAVGVTVKYL